ncbi:Family description [Thermoplasmatales archaeon SCGC AB-539-N05]|nr:Family description [Thermoplasmatales archaeon SCGC AB-539-N05]
MNGKIVLILIIVLSLTSSTIAGAYQISKNETTLKETDDIISAESGTIDIAVASWYYGYDDVTVYYGEGNGNFPIRHRYSPGSSPHEIVTYDFNSDGNLDMAVTNEYSNSVSVLLGDGKGEFLRINSRTGPDPTDIVLGHFNNDSFIDLAVATTSTTNSYVDILIGEGTGRFLKAGYTTFPGIATCLAAGNFNNDAYTDLIFTHKLPDGSRVLFGTGDGNFIKGQNLGGLQSCLAGDLNNDQNDDIIVGNGGSFSVYLGNGTEQFELISTVTEGSSEFMTLGDFNADGYLDIASASSNYGWGSPSEVFVYSNNGDGNYTYVGKVGSKQGNLMDIETADINNDQKLDIVASVTDFAFSESRIVIFKGKGNCDFETKEELSQINAQSIGIAIGNFGEVGLNQKPSLPTIEGPESGNPGEVTDFTFSVDDPENDYVEFEIEWGDGENETTDYCGGSIDEWHNWNDKGTYTVRIRATDYNGGQSDWNSTEIIMPKTRSLNFRTWIHSLFIRNFIKSYNSFPFFFSFNIF